MLDEISFKELYEVSLKATYPIEVGGETIEVGETVAFFDNIQLANFQEIKSATSARGGFDNRARVFWETTKEVKINFTQGVFSKTQLALMTNAKIIKNLGTEVVTIETREALESNENGKITLKHIPQNHVFVYDATTGKKITNYEVAQNIITIGDKYKTVVVDY